MLNPYPDEHSNIPCSCAFQSRFLKVRRPTHGEHVLEKTQRVHLEIIIFSSWLPIILMRGRRVICCRRQNAKSTMQNPPKLESAHICLTSLDRSSSLPSRLASLLRQWRNVNICQLKRLLFSLTTSGEKCARRKKKSHDFLDWETRNN